MACPPGESGEPAASLIGSAARRPGRSGVRWASTACAARAVRSCVPGGRPVRVAGDDGRVREQREPEALGRVLLLALGVTTLRDEVIERRAAGGAERRAGRAWPPPRLRSTPLGSRARRPISNRANARIVDCRFAHRRSASNEPGSRPLKVLEGTHVGQGEHAAAGRGDPSQRRRRLAVGRADRRRAVAHRAPPTASVTP